MRPKNDNLHRLLQLWCDVLGIILAWVIAADLRSLLNPVMSINLDVRTAAMWAPRLDWIIALWLLAAAWLDIYGSPTRLTGPRSALHAAESWVVVVCVTIITTFFSRGFGIGTSRAFVLVFGPVSLVTMMMTRTLAPMVATASRRWTLKTSVAVLGAPAPAARMADRLLQSRFAPEIKGVIVPETNVAGHPESRMRVLGTTGQLAELINREHLDQIIVLAGSVAELEMERCSAISQRMGITVRCAVTMEGSTERPSLNMDYGVPLLEFKPVTFTRGQEVVKRAFDVLGAMLTLVVLAPLMLLIAALIKLTSEGPVFHMAPRVGRGGRHFVFLKFRSMYGNKGRHHVAAANEKDGHIFKVRNDPRVTPLGRILRRYSLDELPQLINVLLGDMSLVGPRPLPAEDLDGDGMSHRFTLWSEQRSLVHPGITGLWQIKGRSELSFEDMMRLDIEYIRSWSLMLDLWILLETPGFVISGRGAY